MSYYAGQFELSCVSFTYVDIFRSRFSHHDMLQPESLRGFRHCAATGLCRLTMALRALAPSASMQLEPCLRVPNQALAREQVAAAPNSYPSLLVNIVALHLLP
jgi:hypothetical protein